MNLIEAAGGYVFGSVITAAMAGGKFVAWLFSTPQNRQTTLAIESAIDLGAGGLGAYKLVTEPDQPDFWKGFYASFAIHNTILGLHEAVKAATEPASLGPLETLALGKTESKTIRCYA